MRIILSVSRVTCHKYFVVLLWFLIETLFIFMLALLNAPESFCRETKEPPVAPEQQYADPSFGINLVNVSVRIHPKISVTLFSLTRLQLLRTRLGLMSEPRWN